jgi:hypothetical protein
MDAQKTILPAIVIEQLYRHSLVVIDEGAETPPSPSASINGPVLPAGATETTDRIRPATAPLRFLGNNSRRIAILVNYPDEPYLPEDSLHFLTNILNACQLNIGDTAIVNAGRQPVDFPFLKESLGMEQLILFGNLPGIIPPTAPFTLESIEGVNTLTAPALDEMNGEYPEAKQLKGKLWQRLKQMFRLSGN